MTFRIVTLNTWGGKIHEPLMTYLQTVDADIICLQEVSNASVIYAPEWTIRRRTGSQERPNLFSEISELLIFHSAMYFASARGMAIDEYGEEFPVEYGIAAFVKRERLSVMSSCSKFVWGSFSEGFGDAPLPRIAHCMRLFQGPDKPPIVVAHMHGLWLPDGKYSCPDRVEQSLNFVRLVESMSTREEKRIVCGDFNVMPLDPMFADLAKIGIRNLNDPYGIEDTRTSYYKKKTRYADYMCVSGAVKVVKFEAPAEPEVSDHRPLVLDFE